MQLIIAFALGVVAGPAFLKYVWPRISAWWQARE